ncbi:MAG: dephospho-CoA kinase [Selenomonadaceae bacterium]|nr:dephospho-CoA kinase [Selenomonadaceae bacterium]
MYIIGLTGGIACGKSSVAEIFRRFGAKTFDVDRETHKLLQCGGQLYSAYVQRFGNIIVEEDGQLNRKLVAEIIFNNESERLWINSVAHPILLNRTRDFLVDCAENGVKLVVLEIPLLFEAGWEFLVDEVWAVYVNISKQRWRLMRRDGLNWEQASNKINAQMSAKEIADRADVVINNHRPGSQVRKQVVPLIQKMLQSL